LAITAPQRERAVAEFLLSNKFSHHWFREKREVACKGQIVSSLRSLFPQYIFVRCSHRWDELRERTKISGFVRFGEELAEVGEKIVTALCVAFPDDIAPESETPSRFTSGQAVDIIGAGPFAGYRAVFLRAIWPDRCILWIDMLGRTVPISVKINDVVERAAFESRNKRKRKRRRTRNWHNARFEQACSHLG
jgi:transcription antitermination factor NusG